MTAFDKYLRTILVRAEHEADEDGSATVEARHMLLAVAAERESTTRVVLDSAGLDVHAIRDALDREFEYSLNAVGVSRESYGLPRPTRLSSHPRLGASAKLALERGVASAGRKQAVRPAHVLLGILLAQVGTVPRALTLAGVDRETLAARALQAVA
jgi:D-alanyl-D-alanine carboxypeptidase